MGVCQSQAGRLGKNESNKINQDLFKAFIEEKRIIKMLLLGAGQSGKSTVLKQIRILKMSGFNERELAQHRRAVYRNTIQAMSALLDAIELDATPFDTLEREMDAKLIRAIEQLEEQNEPFAKTTADALQALWADPLVRRVFGQHRLPIIDSAQYFLDALPRTSLPDFELTHQDILHTRIQTNGVVEMAFSMSNLPFKLQSAVPPNLNGRNYRVIDVGGQRNQRRKWLHQFENVTVVLFVVAVSEFDQVLEEDGETNRLVEALNLYRSISFNTYFLKTTFIIFLNKRDIFEEKIERVPLNNVFPDFRGPNTYEDSLAHLEELVRKQNPAKSNHLHRTCATDTNQMQQLLSSVAEIVTQQNISRF